MTQEVSLRAFLLVGLCFLCPVSDHAQDQRIADSLSKIYNEETIDDPEARLELLRVLSFNEINDLQLSLQYADELIELAKQVEDYLYLHRGYLQKGNSYRLQGNLEAAIDQFFQSSKAAVKADYRAGEGIAHMSIADVYSVLGNSDNAQIYYQKSIEILRSTRDSIAFATALSNAGDEYYKIKKYDEALQYFKESGEIFRRVDYPIGRAYNLGNTGMVYAEQGRHELAKTILNEAMEILEDMGDYYSISVYLKAMADIYANQKDFSTAFLYAQRSLLLAENYGLIEQISDANLKLSQLHDQTGDLQEAYRYYKDYISYRDSLKNIEVVQQLANLRTDFEVSQKQIEVDLLNQQKRSQRIIVFATIIALILIGLLAIGLYRRNKYIQKTNKIIEKERKRSDNLLLNILPEETAEELKENGKVQAKRFESVTVLFTDFQGFTKYSEKLTPEELVESVDYYFSKFDEIMEKYDLEKIKTVGDAYMCAGGLPFPTEDHASKMIQAAFDIIDFVERPKNDFPTPEVQFDIRIGVNTGPVVAGVVGSKKFAYDIWGDTVNVASRMEALSEPGRINISESTYQLIKNDFICDYRGEIEAKNRGELKMYFVSGRRSQSIVETIK